MSNPWDPPRDVCDKTINQEVIVKLNYTCEQFNEDINTIKSYVKSLDKGVANFVSIWRGSAPMGIKLNNQCPDSTLSLIKFQTRDGNDEVPEFLLNNIPAKDSFVVVLDDIFDTGLTLEAVYKFMITEGYTNVFYVTLHNNTKAVRCTELTVKPYSVRNTTGEWIIYPWE